MVLTIVAPVVLDNVDVAAPAVTVVVQQPFTKKHPHPPVPTWSGTRRWHAAGRGLRYAVVTDHEFWTFGKAGWIQIPATNLGGALAPVTFKTHAKATALTAGDGLVAADLNGYLAVRNATTGRHRVIAQQATGIGPIAVDKPFALAGDRSDDKVYKFALPDLRHYMKVPVPGRPNGIAVAGASAWVSTAWSGTRAGYIGRIVGNSDVDRRPLPRGGRIVGYVSGLLWLSLGVTARSIKLERWSAREDQPIGTLIRIGSPIVEITAIGGVVFVLERNGKIVAVNSRTGRVLNHLAFHKPGLSGLASANGLLVVTDSRNGEIADPTYKHRTRDGR